MEQRLSLVTLGVADLDRAAQFYEVGLGWSRNSKDESVVFFQTPGMIVALWPREELAADAGVSAEGSGFRGIALAYNARSREEVDKVLAEAVGAGGTLVKAAADTFWGGYSAYFADPDGHLWEVAFNPFWKIDDEGKVHLNQ
jgi:catechol 2,3-dioxygenase-like lactoylglutathione lyase family enzyme